MYNSMAQGTVIFIDNRNCMIDINDVIVTNTIVIVIVVSP